MSALAMVPTASPAVSSSGVLSVHAACAGDEIGLQVVWDGGTFSSLFFTFGDGKNTSVVTNTPGPPGGFVLNHTYAASGDFIVSAVPRDATSGLVVALSQPNDSCTNDANYSRIVILQCAPVAIAVSANGTAAGYSWQFGDGGSAQNGVATHTYSAAGPFAVRLAVANRTRGTGSGFALTVGSCASGNTGTGGAPLVTPADCSGVVSSDGATCCTDAQAAAGFATDVTAGGAPSRGPHGARLQSAALGNLGLRVSGRGCVGVVGAGSGQVASHVRLGAVPFGTASTSIGERTTLGFSVPQGGLIVNATLETTDSFSGLGHLARPLGDAARTMPNAADGRPYHFVYAIQVLSNITNVFAVPPAVQLQMNLSAADIASGLDGANATLLYWDGSSWVDTRAHVGANIAGQGEPDLFVIDAAPTGTGARALVSHASTYALAAPLSVPAREAPADRTPWYTAIVVLGILAVAILALVGRAINRHYNK
jgi:hypothetical protein